MTLLIKSLYWGLDSEEITSLGIWSNLNLFLFLEATLKIPILESTLTSSRTLLKLKSTQYDKLAPNASRLTY